MSAITELQAIAKSGSRESSDAIYEWIRKWVDSASVDQEYDIYYYRNYYKFDKFLDHVEEVSLKNLGMAVGKTGATCIERDTETKHKRTYRLEYLRKEPRK